MSTEDHLLIYVRYLHPDTLVATTEYLTCVKLLATIADAITTVLLGVMTALGLDVQRMAWFCSDGAATMAGMKSGVAARLKAVNPRIVAVRCVVHHTALVMSDTAKSNSELQAVDSELRQVHNLFNHSSKRSHSGRLLQRVTASPSSDSPSSTPHVGSTGCSAWWC
jgi:hypothetical protein